MKKTVLLFLLLMSFSAATYGQSAVAGAVSGLVTDSSNAVIPNATVTLTNVGTNKEEMITTEGDGRFKFDNLQPGVYTLTIKLPGFADYRQDQIGVEVGRTATVNASLEVGAAAAEVHVVADIPLVNTESKEFASNINQTRAPR